MNLSTSTMVKISDKPLTTLVEISDESLMMLVEISDESLMTLVEISEEALCRLVKRSYVEVVCTLFKLSYDRGSLQTGQKINMSEI